MKRVLSVGNCVPDHTSIRELIEGEFPAQVEAADSMRNALDAIRNKSYDLVLVNRILDADGTSGLEIIRQMKQMAEAREIPVMLITNHQQHQQQAIDTGATLGFGKASLFAPETKDRLRPFLS